jgi:hypothetical protein
MVRGSGFTRAKPTSPFVHFKLLVQPLFAFHKPFAYPVQVLTYILGSDYCESMLWLLQIVVFPVSSVHKVGF